MRSRGGKLAAAAIAAGATLLGGFASPRAIEQERAAAPSFCQGVWHWIKVMPAGPASPSGRWFVLQGDTTLTCPEPSRFVARLSVHRGREAYDYTLSGVVSGARVQAVQVHLNSDEQKEEYRGRIGVVSNDDPQWSWISLNSGMDYIALHNDNR